MSELVRRLRIAAEMPEEPKGRDWQFVSALLRKSADEIDEIEHLRAENARIRSEALEEAANVTDDLAAQHHAGNAFLRHRRAALDYKRASRAIRALATAKEGQ